MYSALCCTYWVAYRVPVLVDTRIAVSFLLILLRTIYTLLFLCVFCVSLNKISSTPGARVPAWCRVSQSLRSTLRRCPVSDARCMAVVRWCEYIPAVRCTYVRTDLSRRFRGLARSMSSPRIHILQFILRNHQNLSIYTRYVRKVPVWIYEYIDRYMSFIIKILNTWKKEFF